FKSGNDSRHGPHQEAQKSSKTSFSPVLDDDEGEFGALPPMGIPPRGMLSSSMTLAAFGSSFLFARARRARSPSEVGWLPSARRLFCAGCWDGVGAVASFFVVLPDEGWVVSCCGGGALWANAGREKLSARERSAICVARFTVAKPRWERILV